MIDGIPVVDAIVHAYLLDPSNYRNHWAQDAADLLFGATQSTSPPGYRLPREKYVRNWGIDEVASLSFAESDTDLAVFHVLPVGSFHQGMCSLDAAKEAAGRWPHRFVVYAGVDPMHGPAALDELDRQVEVLDHPPGLKLYPNSWDADDEVLGWKMDDPEIAFPLFERARRHGIKVVAVHKAVPLGPYPLEHYRVDDIDRAAVAFPDLKFEIVHGGMAFLEETAWQLARFPNVFVNLEITTSLAVSRPRAFAHAMATLMEHGGEQALSKIVWGTGAMAYHPQPHLEAFRDFEFTEAELERFGVPQLTRERKAAILGGNYARLVDLDVPDRLSKVADDEFARMRADGRPAPYATTKAGHGV